MDMHFIVEKACNSVEAYWIILVRMNYICLTEIPNSEILLR